MKALWLGLARDYVLMRGREESRQISGVEELASEETSYAPLNVKEFYFLCQRSSSSYLRWGFNLFLFGFFGRN